MAILTLYDGSQVQVPDGLTQEEELNLVAKAFPEKVALAGVTYDFEREFDLTSGIPDLGSRWGLALADKNPEEVKAELDERVGAGNWGVTDFGEPYATPEGLRRLGIEPKDNRKVLFDGIGTDLYDLVDIAPEVAVGAGALAAELLPIPGSGVAGATAVRGMLSALTSRGLVARSLRAGAGDAAVNVGLEGIQELRGTNRESFGEILQKAGTEGALVAVGSMVLGLPFEGLGPLANKIKDVSKNLPIEKRGVNLPDIQDMVAAGQRTASAVGPDDAMLISLRTYLGAEGTLFGKLVSTLEGFGAKQMGDLLPDQAMRFIEKYRQIVLDSARLGDDDLTTAAKLKANLNTKEQDFAKQIAKGLQDWTESPHGKLDKVNTTVRGMKDFTQQKLLRQYRVGMNAFEGEKYYGNPVFSGLDEKYLTNQRLSNFMNRVSEESEIPATELLQSMPAQTGSRISSKVDITAEGYFKPRKEGKIGERISAGDLFKADRLIRKAAYSKRATDLNTVYNNLNISSAIQNGMAKLPEVSGRFKTTLERVNKDYSKFTNLYRGKNGLFKQLAERPGDDAEAFFKSLITGKEGAEFTTLINKLDTAFGKKAVGAAEANALGLETADEILGQVGVNYIRKGLIELQGATDIAAQKKVAAKLLDQLNTFKTTVKSKYAKTTQAAKSWNRLFSQGSIDEYEKILKSIKTGTPEQAAKANQKAGLVFGFKEAEQFVDKIAKAGSSLKTADLQGLVQELRLLKNLDPKSADYAKDLLYSEIWTKLAASGGPGDAVKRNTAIKAWADDFIGSMSKEGNPEALKELLGPAFDGLNDLALTIRGALNLDPNAGAISAAGQPLSAVHKFMQGSFVAAVKPIAFMYTSKQFGPGQPLWKMIQKMVAEGRSADDIAKALGPKTTMILGKGQSIADNVLAGRNGLMAAAISSFMEQAHESRPLISQESNISVQKTDTTPPEQEATIDMASQEQQLGNAIMNMLKASQEASSSIKVPDVSTSLAQGRAIAAGR